MNQEHAPLVSVIMPAFNAELYIEEAINSIINQTYQNWELIILDDCSSDSTYAIASDYVAKDPRIKVFRNPENLYIAKNRNKGIALAKGKYIAWQDADDVSLPDRLSLQVALMEKDSEIGICGGFLQSFDEFGDLDVRTYEENDEKLRKTIFKFSPVAQPCALVKKDCLDKVGVFDPLYPPAEDLDLSFRIGQHYKFANVPKVLLRYREHPASNTYSKMKKMLTLTLQIRRKYSKDYGYKMTFSDKAAYAATYLMQYLNPRVTMFIFKKSRKTVTNFRRIWE